MTEKVFVPKFPGIPVFENYRGVPANESTNFSSL